MSEWYTNVSGERFFAGPVANPDRYRLEEVVSEGLEGRLWRSSLPVDGHRFQVAVKEIHQRNVASLAEWLERWERQAELLRSLDHPGLVRVREVFQGAPAHLRGAAVDGERSLFLVMNWADGRPFHEWASNRGRGERMAALAQVASAVDHLHSGADTNGVAVLHRDIKPQNIIVDDAGRPRLVDFGFARLADGTDYTLVGSAHFMAPEIPLGVVPTPASDRYSFGCVAYTVLTGRPVQPAEPVTVAKSIETLRASGLPAELADHLHRLLQHQPGDRPNDLSPWHRIAHGGFAAAGSATSDQNARGATEMRPAGWMPPPTDPPVIVSTPGTISGAPPLLTSPAASYQTTGPVSWPPVHPTTTGYSLPPGQIPGGHITLSPDSFGGSGRQWSSAVGIGLGVAALLIGIVAGAVWFIGRPDPTPTTTSTTATTTTLAPVVLPELVGKTRTEVEAALTGLGLTPVVTYVASARPGEEVVQVDPAAGSQLQSAGRVTVSVSKPSFTMPELRGRTVDAARRQLVALGHLPALVMVTPNDASDGDVIIAQAPEPNVEFKKDGNVQIRAEEDRPPVTASTPTTTSGGGTVLPPATAPP